MRAVGAGTGFPERLWMSHPWTYSRPGWMGPWAAWSSIDMEDIDMEVGGFACGRGAGA